MRFNRAPYSGDDVYLLPAFSPQGRAWSAALTTALQWAGSSTGLRYHLLYQHQTRLGFEAELSRYSVAQGAHKQPAYQAAALTFVSAEGADYVLGFSLGAARLASARHYNGPSLGIYGQYFPLRPFSVRAASRLTTFNDKPLWDVDVALLVHAKNIAATAGYRRLQGPEISVAGPTAGLSIWF